jgi:lantibiotic modifying enzyme
MVAWCHGAAGIGLARLRAYQLLPQRRPELQISVEQAVRTTAAYLQTLPADFDASPCHGRGGLAETLLHASATLDDRQYANQALGMWVRTVRTRAVSQQWPVGVVSGRNNPSLMLGQAGIGYALLRASYPDEVPSILLIEPDR